MCEEESGFKVSDKRKFDADGNPREETAKEEKARDKTEKPRVEPVAEPEGLGKAHAEAESEAGSHTEDKEPAAGEINFTTFILSLGTQAMISLGLIPDPTTNETSVSLANAKQMIDILTILREKTQGNLDASETSLMDSLLYDLHMQFVELSSKQEN
ncbi:MAG TPA: DUF1844 domain-containing protein [Acidobacteriota bacterium]|nr:DUF1844 domain-containing protein [Acidobacteriota bacterium]